MDLDDTDTRLLTALQRNAQLTAQELADILNLSPSQAGRRKQRLEALGVIKTYLARLDPNAIGLSVQAFADLKLAAYQGDAFEDLRDLLDAQPEIISAWTLTGGDDYLLHIFCRDLAALHSLLYDVLLPHSAVANVTSRVVLDQPVSDTPLPT